jgi:hypothetical protein
MLTIAQRNNNEDEFFRQLGDGWQNNIRVAIPGIIQSFDSTTQTVSVQPAIREAIRDVNNTQQWVNLPLLVDVPIVLPRAGGFVATFPIQAGDECLVIFADMCIDAWFSNGGIQNQIEKRRHDLSDCFAILGCWSQPNVISNYSTDSIQLRNDSGTSYIEIKDTEININSATVKINNKNFATHTHTVPSGGGTTSGVN